MAGRRRQTVARGRLRYTKAALLLFGLGLVLGLVVVAGELPGFERVASGVMALAIVSLPFALVADGRGTAVDPVSGGRESDLADLHAASVTRPRCRIQGQMIR